MYDLAPRIAPLATGGSGSTAGCFPGVCVGGGRDNGPASMRPSQSDVEQGLRGVGADRVSRRTKCGLRATWGTDALPTSSRLTHRLASCDTVAIPS